MDYNEIARMMLKESHPNKDVKVALDGGCFGGIWCWNGSFHERTPLYDLQAKFSTSLELFRYLRSIPLVKIQQLG